MRQCLVLLVAAALCLHAHATSNSADIYGDTSCTGSPSQSFSTDSNGACKDGTGSTSSMMFCSNYGTANNLMTLVTFSGTGCSTSQVALAGMFPADTTTCTASPDNTKGIKATCSSLATGTSYNRVLYDASSASCASTSAAQKEVIFQNGVCMKNLNSRSAIVWCGDNNLAVISIFASTDCTGSETTTVLQQDSCGAVTSGGSGVGGVKVTCDVGKNKNIFSDYEASTDCSGLPTFTALTDNGVCYNASDSDPSSTKSVMSFHHDGKVHTALWNDPSCQGSSVKANMYQSSTCVAGETGSHWNTEMHADDISRPRVKVEHFYSTNDCTGSSNTDNDNNGACFDHAATTTSLQAWCSKDKSQGVASLFSATGCGLSDHAQTTDFQSGVCLAVPGTTTESIKVTCGATAATLSALVLALPLLLAAWLRDAA